MEYSGRTPALAAGETVLWRGKPQKKGFIATRCLTMLPIAAIWLVIDMQFILMSFSSDGPTLMLIPFFALHLMPVWIWLGSAVTSVRRWKNTMYFATNRRIIIQDGFFAVNETSLYYKDIRNTRVRVGLLDKLFGTGDLLFDDGFSYRGRRNQIPVYSFEDLEDAQQVYQRIQKIVLDMQTDMEYPNAFRPENNPGYNTDYRF